jgi:DNA (cytosine-5)-methyltransferase 1
VKPLLLDLYCCQGGSAMGWHLAGFDVVGVDINPQPRYPFEFHQGDAIEFIRQHGHEFTISTGSPPCQRDSDCQRIQGNEHPDLIAATRDAMNATGKPWVIENVRGALPKLRNPIMLCGPMFGLETYRHRYFEAGGGLVLTAPPHPEHVVPQVKMGRAIPPGHFGQFIGNFSGVDHARHVMGMPWANRDGLREAIPPAYTEYLGRQILAQLVRAAA